MAPHSSTLAWKIPWMGEHGGLQSMGWRRVGHDSATSLSLFTCMHWRRQWQPTPVFLPGESQGWGSLVGCCLWGRTESHTTEVTQQQQQQHMRNLKYDTNELICEAEADSQTQRADLWLSRGGWGQREVDWEFGISRCSLLSIEWTNNKGLLYGTGSYTQYPMINHNGKEHEKEYMQCVCITASLCCTPETKKTL